MLNAPAFIRLPSSLRYDAASRRGKKGQGSGDDSPHLARFQFFILPLSRLPNGITIQPDGDDLGVYAKARRDFF